MVSNYEEVIAEVSKELSRSGQNPNTSFSKDHSNSKTASKTDFDTQAVIPRVLEALLSKAPKPFLSSLDFPEFAEVVRLITRSLENWTQNNTALFVEPFSGKDFFYITVVMKDCPFIINTFNNIIERLGLLEIVTLHPIFPFEGSAASLGVLVFSGLENHSQQQLVDELRRTLPLLSRACADFGLMTQSAQRQSDLCLDSGRSLWSLDISELINWFVNGGFVFLGAVNAQFISEGKSNTYNLKNHAGILAFDYPEFIEILKEVQSDYLLFKDDERLRINKLTRIAPVHYPQRLLHVAIRNPKSGEIQSFIGTLTSRAISEEAAAMPIVRLKLDELVRRSQVAMYGYDHKALVRHVNSTPKNHLLISDIDSLAAELKLVQDVEFLGSSIASLSLDESGRGVTTVIGFSPTRYYSEMRRELKDHLEARLSATGVRSDLHLTSMNDSVARIYFYTPCDRKQAGGPPLKSLLKEIADELGQIALGWSGRFEIAVESQFGNRAQTYLQRYHSAFTGRYQALTDPTLAVKDIESCECLSEKTPIRVRLDLSGQVPVLNNSLNEDIGTLSILSLSQQLTLAQTLPVLENLGLEVLDSETLKLERSLRLNDDGRRAQENIFLHRFFIKQVQSKITNLLHFDEVVAPAIETILREKPESDSLNALLLSANLDSRAVLVLRIYSHLLWQIRKTSSRLTMRIGLTRNPKAAVLLWELFQVKFDPAILLSVKQRVEEFEKIWLKFQAELKTIKDISDDSILKALAQLVVHTVRTNFFKSPTHVALKIHSEKLPLLRGARPLYETFVYGPAVEGIHLRSSKVSRGGIRWSDRRDDYRTEVLGLMRVQRIKNAIVVPSGAKGGFVIKDSGQGQSVSRETVVAGYKEYIRALLSLADNMQDGKTVGPKDLIVYDEADPYLVVAADKGTAAFSDYANQIATEEYNFWLNDGFASGGSKGYGHKELAITARGAWECTKQHFIELGIDYEQVPFTVVGIGDMSGDVFGNGLLLSKNMKLIAAFDHRHVFIDPQPNLEISYQERARLFQLPRSSWADYQVGLISKGGGIFNRLDKDIQLSPEARAALAISDAEVGPFTGEQIISLALKAPVDLLWNGGIGTYVKGSNEVDSEVNDSANDAVRISGTDLRARVVAEGGNVGFTQAARVEFALRGGLINTDSIDNSAGVDLSDHEVNLKILFQKLQSSNLATRDQRDSLMKQVSNEVSEAVLSHNRNQAFVISIAERASKKSLDYFRALIRELCDRNYITRAIDGLPSDDELEKRSLRRVGMTRPEIAICLAGIKLWIKDEILRSGIAKDIALSDFARDYFPKVIREQFKDQLLSHPLVENITAAELTNHIVDLVGITFVHRLQLTEGVDICDALRATIAASQVLGAKGLLERLETLNTFARRNDFFEARLDLGRAVRVVATQLIHRFSNELNISECLNLYQKLVKELFSRPEQAISSGAIGESFQKHSAAREKTGLSVDLSKEISFLHISWLILDASDIARTHSVNVLTAHRLLVFVWEKLGLDFLVLQNQSLGAKNKWEHELMMSSYDALRSSVAKLGASLISKGKLNNSEIDFAQIQNAIETSPSFPVIETTIAEFTTNTPEVAVLHALARHMENFRLN